MQSDIIFVTAQSNYQTVMSVTLNSEDFIPISHELNHQQIMYDEPGYQAIVLANRSNQNQVIADEPYNRIETNASGHQVIADELGFQVVVNESDNRVLPNEFSHQVLVDEPGYQRMLLLEPNTGQLQNTYNEPGYQEIALTGLNQQISSEEPSLQNNNVDEQGYSEIVPHDVLNFQRGLPSEPYYHEAIFDDSSYQAINDDLRNREMQNNESVYEEVASTYQQVVSIQSKHLNRRQVCVGALVVCILLKILGISIVLVVSRRWRSSELSTSTQIGILKSAEHMFSFTVHHLIDSPRDADISTLSVSSSGRQLLIGKENDDQLYIYSTNGSYLASINLPNGVLFNAVWTPRGNIVSTMYKQDQSADYVVVMTPSGDVINQTWIQDKDARHFSVFANDTIYLAGLDNVYESADDGVTWNPVFQSYNAYGFLQAIRIPAFNQTTLSFWTVEEYEKIHCRIHAFTETRRSHVNGSSARNEVALSYQALADKICVGSSLMLVGESFVLMTDYNNTDVHVWSVDGQYVGQLLSSQYSPVSLATSSQQDRVLFVGQKHAVVSVYTLMYE